MQLFSIGLIMLNRDGTPLLDEAGQQIQTYSNDDIMDFSRACAHADRPVEPVRSSVSHALFTCITPTAVFLAGTGFDLQPPRGNIEHYSGDTSDNLIDPMQIKPAWRDPFPKMDLYSNYIGDGYPLCNELPRRGFLRKGARFRLLGYSDTPVWTNQPGMAIQAPGRFTLDFASPLYAVLSNVSSADIVLNEHLTCHGAECRVETLDIINVSLSNGRSFFYEYIRPPCVEFAFYENGKAVHEIMDDDEHLCADPLSLSGGASCCSGYQQEGLGMCEYFGEVLPFHAAKQRCDAASRPGAHLALCRAKTNWHYTCGYAAIFTWLDTPCQVQVQVHPTGWVNLVHSPTTISHFAIDNKNLFRVRWLKGHYPSPSAGCGTCATHGDTCLCNVTAHMAPVFTDGAQVPTLASDVDRALPIGSPPPDAFDSGAFTRCTSGWCSNTGAEVWLSSSSGGNLDMDTIFVVTRNGTAEKVYLRNKISTVYVGGTDGLGSTTDAPYSFRNAPHFVSFQSTHKTARDAEFETEATLDHYVTHPNTAPFLAYRLIQRLTSSNPSPRYIKAAADAFVAGAYPPASSLSFSGKYGDLGALFAAILLDREARSASLEADPTHGGLREPVLKLLHVLRAMEYRAFTRGELDLYDVDGRIGQYVFESPSVFNFYLPEFAPAGAITNAGLVAPESQIYTTPNLISFLNGMSALLHDGLSSCHGGFGSQVQKRQCGSFSKASGLLNRRETADGNLTYALAAATPAEVVAELDLLLTGGRLEERTQSIVQGEYESALASGDSPIEAMRLAQQLIIAAPEFHASTAAHFAAQLRPPSSTIEFLDRPYKAILVIFLHGGIDVSTCEY